MAIDSLERQFSQAQRDGLPARLPTYPQADGYLGVRLETGELLRNGHLFPILHATRK